MAGTPARKYSWPPFEKGNTAAMRHGAWSPRKVDPLAAELVEALLGARPELAAYGPLVWAWARAEARCQLLDEWTTARGLIGPDGEPLAGLRYVAQFERQAAELREQLGLTPGSEARIARDRAAVVAEAVDLEAVRERGRAARLARREALGAGTGDDTGDGGSGAPGAPRGPLARDEEDRP